MLFRFIATARQEIDCFEWTGSASRIPSKRNRLVVWNGATASRNRGRERQIHQSARSIVSIARVRASKVARPRFHCPPCSSLSASSSGLREDTFPRVFRGRPFSSRPISAEGSIDRNHPRFSEIVRFERGIIRCMWKYKIWIFSENEMVSRMAEEGSINLLSNFILYFEIVPELLFFFFHSELCRIAIKQIIE